MGDRLKLVILGHFLPFYSTKNPKKSKVCKIEKNCLRFLHIHFTQIYQKSQSYDVRFLRYEVKQKESFDILGHFLPFYPINNPQNQNFEKMKKRPGDIIGLY